MKEYMYTKTLGVIVGTLTIFVAIGFGILAFIAMGLSKNTGYDSSSTDRYPLLILILLLLFGLITGIGSFKLNRKAWKIFYTGFCFLLGTGFVVVFFVSFGALGFKNEIFILCMGIIYILLGYLAKRKK
jgi:hypothetical protein